MMVRLALALALSAAVVCGADEITSDTPPPAQASPARQGPAARLQSTPVCGYQVVNTYPHDPAAFTQGLAFDHGDLFEGTGLWGESTLRRVDLLTGQVLQIHHLGDEYFGEGITVWGDRLIQLTYVSHVGFIYDRDTFAELGTFSYPTQGWGITTDGNRLVMSDGSAFLRFWDPVTFDLIGYVAVWDEAGPVTWLNELERIDDHIWANVLYSDRIARIDPGSGQVTSWVDLTGILDPGPQPGPLNGIAHDPATGRTFVTGKLWPTLYEIELVDCQDLLVFSGGFESGDLSGWQ
jgi:glutamine cyclotransferase